MRNLGVGKLFHSPKIAQVGSEEAGGDIFSFLEQVSPMPVGRISPVGGLGAEGPGEDREGREWKGQRRRANWGGSADFVGGGCGPQKPLSCSELARPLSLSLCLSFLTCKQHSKSLKATGRLLVSWYRGSGCEQRQDSPHARSCGQQLGGASREQNGRSCPPLGSMHTGLPSRQRAGPGRGGEVS